MGHGSGFRGIDRMKKNNRPSGFDRTACVFILYYISNQ